MTKITKEIVELGLKEHQAMEELTFLKKYPLEGEKTLKDTKKRIARLVPEHLRPFVESDEFIPAGSILAGALNDEIKCSMSNCYFTPIEGDSLEDIFECCKKIARTYSFRGGTGIDISVLRPKSTKVNNSALYSSGAVSFAPLYSMVTTIIGQDGEEKGKEGTKFGRRGALMILENIKHPDTLDFIWSKSKPEQVFAPDVFTGRYPDISGANISVAITDEFMDAVKHDLDWTFSFPNRDADTKKYDKEWKGNFDRWDGDWKYYKTMPAREVMRQIAESAWTSGDPGVLFIDTARNMTPSIYSNPDAIVGCNPCGEQILQAWENCLLGALVLSKFVFNPWTPEAYFDHERFLDAVEHAVIALNHFSDANEDLHPLEEQRKIDKFGKRIGVEFTALADTLAMLGIEYGSDESLNWLDRTLRDKALREISTSSRIASELGCCPAMSTIGAIETFINSPYFQGLEPPKSLVEYIKKYGLRNTAFNTVGPTGSISIIEGNTSSGVEPVFAVSYQRKTRLSDKSFEFIHKPILKHLNTLPEESLEKYSIDSLGKDFNYVESHALPWQTRLKLQSVVQKYTDSSISSTVNLPNDATPETIMDIYITAHTLGLKGVTIFRDGCKDGVLSTGKDNTPKDAENFYVRELLDIEKAERHRVLWKGAKMYITVSLDENDQPVEVFVKLPREAGNNGGGHYREELYQEKVALWDTVTRLASLHLRAGMPLSQIIKQLDKGSYTMADAGFVLARILRKYHYKELEQQQDETGIGEECPECGELAYIYQSGCPVCQKCGYSNCG